MDDQVIDKTYFTTLYKQIRLQEFLEVAHTILLDRLENGSGKTVKGVPLGCLPVELFREHFANFRCWRSYTKERPQTISNEKTNVQHLYYTFNVRSGFPTLSGKEWVKKKVINENGEVYINEYQKVTFIISYRDTRVECDFKMQSISETAQQQQLQQQQQHHSIGQQLQQHQGIQQIPTTQQQPVVQQQQQQQQPLINQQQQPQIQMTHQIQLQQQVEQQIQQQISQQQVAQQMNCIKQEDGVNNNNNNNSSNNSSNILPNSNLESPVIIKKENGHSESQQQQQPPLQQQTQLDITQHPVV